MINKKISNRLKTIGDLVNNNSTVVDVGCDHGLLSIYLYLNRKNIKITASDINKKPLDSALENIKRYKLEDKIKLVLSDGLSNIDDFFDTLIISGLGGNTIINIIYKDVSKLKNTNQIILGPQNNLFNVRQKIVNLGFYIDKEVLVEDKNIIYTIIKFKRGIKKYNKNDLIFGPLLLNSNNKLFLEVLNNKLHKYTMILKNIPRKKFVKRFMINIYINKIRKIIKKES